MAFAPSCFLMSIPLLSADASYQANKVLLDGVYAGIEANVSNIANCRTPGYERVQVHPEFRERLATALKEGKKPIPFMRPAIQKDNSSLMKNEIGNNVNLEKELMEMKELSLQQQYLTFCMGNTLKQIQAAASGRGI